MSNAAVDVKPPKPDLELALRFLREKPKPWKLCAALPGENPVGSRFHNDDEVVQFFKEKARTHNLFFVETTGTLVPLPGPLPDEGKLVPLPAEEPAPESMLDAALSLAAKGTLVFPCK